MCGRQHIFHLCLGREGGRGGGGVSTAAAAEKPADLIIFDLQCVFVVIHPPDDDVWLY